MELLLSKQPIVADLSSQSLTDLYTYYIQTADCLNVATGFITNEAVAEIMRAVQYREYTLRVDMFIGMNYLQGFTCLQYNAVKKLNAMLVDHQIGHIYLSPKALYHGKMYSFSLNGTCLAACLGSSNLGSFVGSSHNYIESDVLFSDKEAVIVDERITQIRSHLGAPLETLPEITNFLPAEKDILEENDFVKKLTAEEMTTVKAHLTGDRAIIPLKTEEKSNLNTYFGAGKIKNKYSRRGWYEVELIISKRNTSAQLLPTESVFKVVTFDGYCFDCKRQGDYYKNLRSAHDLQILGQWIKRHMENQGALEIGQRVTEQVLTDFKHHNLVFERTSDDLWYLNFD